MLTSMEGIIIAYKSSRNLKGHLRIEDKHYGFPSSNNWFHASAPVPDCFIRYASTVCCDCPSEYIQSVRVELFKPTSFVVKFTLKIF